MKQPIKQTIIYLFLSIVVVLFAKYVHVLLVYIDMLYIFVNLKLAPIFSDGSTGIMIRKVISRVIKGRNMPYFIEITWFLWLVIVLSKLLIR